MFVTSGKSLFVSSGRYRRLIRATTETNTEGSVCEDEIIAPLIMREVAFAAGNAVIAVQKPADLHDALHAVLLADGLDGSLEAAQQHVAIVKEQMQRGNREAQAHRRAMHGLPPLSS